MNIEMIMSKTNCSREVAEARAKELEAIGQKAQKFDSLIQEAGYEIAVVRVVQDHPGYRRIADLADNSGRLVNAVNLEIANEFGDPELKDWCQIATVKDLAYVTDSVKDFLKAVARAMVPTWFWNNLELRAELINYMIQTAEQQSAALRAAAGI